MAQNIVSKISGNPVFKSSPLAALKSAISDAQAAQTDRQQTRIDGLTKKAILGNNQTALDAALKQLAAYVESVSAGDEATILSAGLAVKSDPAPIGVVPAPAAVSAAPGAVEGSIALKFKPVHGAYSYEIQTSLEPITPVSWTSRPNTTRTRVRVDNLPVAQRCWFRVRAIGAAGPGPWSDPALKLVA